MKHCIKSFSLIVAVAFLMTACSGNKKQTQSELMSQDSIRSNVAEFIYPLPTAFEVTEMLNRIGASYILSLSNPTENVEKYFTEKSRALALGVYGADLSYASTYNQKQIAIDYMNVSNKLVEALDIADAIDKTIVEKVERAENDKEQLINLISNTFYSTYEYLNKNERVEVSVYVLAGSWIEALYISTHISEDTYNNIEMVKIVMDQKEPMNKLMNMIKQHNSNAQMKELEDLMSGLHAIFNKLETGSISEEQMNDITSEIASIRSKII